MKVDGNLLSFEQPDGILHVLRVEMPDSQKRFLEIHYFPVPDHGTIRRIAIIVHDLTKIREIQGPCIKPETIVQAANDGFVMVDQQGWLQQ